MDIQTDVLAALQRAARRDAEKGGCGIRSSRDVADVCGVSLKAARDALDGLYEFGVVDWFGKIDGCGHHWRLAVHDQDNDGLPLPATMAA